MPGIVKFLRRNAAAYMFLTPWLLGFLVLTLYPMVYSLWLGFTNYDFTKPDSTQWIGLGNYLKMFGPVFGLSEFTASNGEVMRVDPYYLKSLSVTFTYVFVSVPLKLIFALAVAMLMNQKLRGVSFYRAVYYIPTLLGGSVAIAVLWRKLFEKDGLVNGLLGAIGFTDLPGWITNPKYALWTLILLTVWQFGSSMIIFLAGLKQIPEEYYEAASVDGANKVRQFFCHNHTLALAGDPVQPGDADDLRLPGVHPGLYHRRRKGRRAQLHAVLYPPPVSPGLDIP